MRVRGTVEYLGTGWSGWQVQPNAPTIQGALERALQVATGLSVRVASAGRTDAGVHARGQVIAFDLPDTVDLRRLLVSLNALAGRGIGIVDLTPARADFDPRRDARRRSYEYTIVNARPASPFLADRSWLVRRPLDDTILHRLAAHVLGTRDFRAFRAADCEARTTVREVIESAWGRDGAVLTYRVTANAFLKQMVRNLVGSMVDVATGRLEEETFVRLLEGGGERPEAGRTAPAAGLTLVEVGYPFEAAEPADDVAPADAADPADFANAEEDGADLGHPADPVDAGDARSSASLRRRT
jgi:tRNA pseudouridine38-40 synthase